ncbi:hypothetical protein [Dyadobacter aurulentus]|uniref:hypothetical protein n=1 Tax=Dyadobacter sp. UC 10 TaxID=2605428 RepID=UPI0011F18DAA|nr:hypothetical protein [Dyadobacter sp. UC 10]KAA0990513.1 hypothetical protein FXO21_10260 [Dyadobacter sp. UC 10]
MKKFVYIFLLLITSLAACKKERDKLDVVPEPGSTGDAKAAEFLKSLRVTGVEEVSFDSVSNSFYVNLPDTYNAEEAEVILSMQQDIVLVDSLDKPINGNVILHAYKGTPPLRFQLRDKSDKKWFYFNVYFNFSGTPQIELLQKEIPINASGANLPLRFTAKVGSIPSSVEQLGPIVKISNKKTGFFMESSYYSLTTPLYLGATEELITNDPLTMEFKFFNQTPVVFEGIKFTRGVPNLYATPSYKFQYSYKDTLKAAGGYFLPQEKYTVKISSDFLAAPVSVAAKVEDAQMLTLDKIPANLPQGSYLASFYEKETLLGKISIQISNFETDCLETIWKGDVNKALDRNVEPLSFSKGDVFYAKSLPLTFGSADTNFDVNRLPRLRLRSPGKTVDLAPKLVVYDWAVAGRSFALGQYTIPADLPAGEYAVTGIYTNRFETQPYWSKLKVK